jgi:hypothetical protein
LTVGESKYYATNTDATTAPVPPGDNFSKELSATEPGSGTISGSVKKNATETDFVLTQSPEPNETDWDGNYSFDYDNGTASATAHLTVSFVRFNSGGTPQETKASDTGETTLSSATTYTFNLGSATWTSPAASDLLGVKLDLRNSHTKDAYSIVINLPGTLVNTPWGVQEVARRALLGVGR